MARHPLDRKPASAGSRGRPNDCRDFVRLMEGLAAEALQFVPPERVAAMTRQWLTRSTAPADAVTVRRAASLASYLALFSASASGATAIDRLARRRSSLSRDEEAAIAALRRSRFRLLRVEREESAHRFTLCDLASHERLHVQDARLTVRGIGLALAGRTAPLDGGTEVLIGPLIILDAASLGMARADGKVLGNPERCAEAIFRHVVRHGEQDPAELAGGDADDALPFGPEDSVLGSLAFAWAAASSAAAPADEEIQRARELSSIGALADALAASVIARQRRDERLAGSYARLAEIQIEVIQRRSLAGVAGPTLDAVGAAIAEAPGAGNLRAAVGALFEDLRHKVRFAPEARAATDAGEERLIQRIQGLRAKTVAQGCTEQEALAAAEKVAELLDRYGLSLSELELRRQTCRGIGIETGRRRVTALDECVPDIAAFFDCRCWSQKLASGVLRHIVFGLRGDVEAAQYLYALVEGAFTHETALFERQKSQMGLDSGGRRGATHSFQAGLGRGICEKLGALRQARENGLRSASGRDLVPLKAAIVDHELDRLGLRFRSRSRAARRLVRIDAYEAGRAAGRRFEYRPGVRAAS